MQELATTACQDSPGRLLVPAAILTRRAWGRAFGPFRVPRYRSMIWELVDLGPRLRVVELWQQVFGDRAPLADSDSLTHQFVWRVNNELFPVDLTELDRIQEMIWSTDEDEDEFEAPPESILDVSIPILGHGIPWEVAGRADTAPAYWPLLAVCAAHLPWGPDCGTTLEKQFRTEVQEYWAERGMDPPPWNLPPEEDGLRLLQAALRLQPPPFDGLAGVLACACKNTANTFLDTVSGAYCCEYLDDIWEWYDGWDDAERQVIQVLARLAAGNWHIEEDKIIYHDRAL